MRIFFTGGTGFVGTYLTEGLAKWGHEITILTRSKVKSRKMPPGCSFLQGDPKEPGIWQEELLEHDAVINLAGASIFKRWSRRARKIIRDSRVLTTRSVVEALAKGDGKGKVLVSTSAVGYYGSRDDDVILDENSPPGNDFLADLGCEWESEARRAEEFGVRVALARFGIVLGRTGGALKQMLPVFRKGLGSPLGSGKQWFPWIHEADLLNIMVFLLEKEHLSGPVNCTAPNAVTNREMSRTLARVLHRPLMPSVPGFLIKTVLGEFGNVILKGQRVIPKRLLDEGFSFQFPTLPEALKDLLQRS
jgi:uncharacterized protein (TIGR01777 family)